MMPGLSLAILAALILLNGYFAMAELAVVWDPVLLTADCAGGLAG